VAVAVKKWEAWKETNWKVERSAAGMEDWKKEEKQKDEETGEKKVAVSRN